MSKQKRPGCDCNTPGRHANRKGSHENKENISQTERSVKRRRGAARMDQEQVQKPGYWAVLPAAVRYDPQLPPSAKILYAEISALTDQRGFCFASNAYFQSLFGMTDRTVQRILKTLQEHGYIRIENGSGGAGRRKIYAGINPLAETADSTEQEPRQKCRGNPDKNVGDISIVNNIPPTSPPGGERAKSKTVKREPSWKPERFAGFWNYYPKSAHKSKQAAIKAWDQLKPGDELIDEIAKALRRQMATDQWQRGIGIPYPSTYLRQRRWEDEIADPDEPEPQREDLPWI